VRSDVEFFATDKPHENRPASFQVYAPARTLVVYALEDVAASVHFNVHEMAAPAAAQ
jgi:hypothetical protein